MEFNGESASNLARMLSWDGCEVTELFISRVDNARTLARRGRKAWREQAGKNRCSWWIYLAWRNRETRCAASFSSHFVVSKGRVFRFKWTHVVRFLYRLEKVEFVGSVENVVFFSRGLIQSKRYGHPSLFLKRWAEFCEKRYFNSWFSVFFLLIRYCWIRWSRYLRFTFFSDASKYCLEIN